MLLELIIFAVVLVALQIAGYFVMMHIMMKQFLSKKFILKYTKMGMDVAKEIAEEMEDYL
jgi:hypothetical protein